ncbi:HEL146Wp [Eremothecium sinecaudum]|uniref:HEL146Wp n=1 Tax=Eremothecium sinecaudum TaxID=45286 RepID=A0A120K2C9_9SACH|nr:HEL146Wp [Eremothecium sinecaudum]AMD21135.1 HEL146Wp [Eremothecium sinecaudum]
MKVASNKKTSSKILSSTVILLTLVAFIYYTASNVVTLYDSILGVDYGQVEAALLGIQLGGDSEGSSGDHTVGETRIFSDKAEQGPTHSQLLTPDSVSVTKNEEFQPLAVFQEIMNTAPIVLFIRGDHADSQYMKKLLDAEYEVTPPVAVVDLKKHAEGDKLQKYIMLNKLNTYNTNFKPSDDIPDVPYLFINGNSIINTSLDKDIKTLHATGLLEEKLKSMAHELVSIKRISPPSNS